LAEVRQLRRLGYGPEFPSQAALGYRELHRFCDGEQSLVDAVARTKSATRKFAKRQRTWFRADPEIRWFDAVEEKQAAIEWGAAFLEKNVPSPSNIGDNSLRVESGRSLIIVFAFLRYLPSVLDSGACAAMVIAARWKRPGNIWQNDSEGIAIDRS
jgi:hypothetical protein